MLKNKYKEIAPKNNQVYADFMAESAREKEALKLEINTLKEQNIQLSVENKMLHKEQRVIKNKQEKVEWPKEREIAKLREENNILKVENEQLQQELADAKLVAKRMVLQELKCNDQDKINFYQQFTQLQQGNDCLAQITKNVLQTKNQLQHDINRLDEIQTLAQQSNFQFFSPSFNSDSSLLEVDNQIISHNSFVLLTTGDFPKTPYDNTENVDNNNLAQCKRKRNDIEHDSQEDISLFPSTYRKIEPLYIGGNGVDLDEELLNELYDHTGNVVEDVSSPDFSAINDKQLAGIYFFNSPESLQTNPVVDQTIKNNL